MKKIVRLTESDLVRLVKRVIMEQEQGQPSQMTLIYQKPPVGFTVTIDDTTSKITKSEIYGKKEKFNECKIDYKAAMKRNSDLAGGTVKQVENKSEYYIYDFKGYQVGKNPFKSI